MNKRLLNTSNLSVDTEFSYHKQKEQKYNMPLQRPFEKKKHQHCHSFLDEGKDCQENKYKTQKKVIHLSNQKNKKT